jgi:ABC-2 type transport system ATP-binding protein
VRAVGRDDGAVHLTVSEPHVTLPALLSELASASVALTGLTTRHASLEDVFVSLTGRHLRDDAHER